MNDTFTPNRYNMTWGSWYDALRTAEAMAQSAPTEHAVIYELSAQDLDAKGCAVPGASTEPAVPTNRAASAGVTTLPAYPAKSAPRGARLVALLASDPAPEGGTALVTVSRKPPHSDPRGWYLKDAVRNMLDNLPQGLVLADDAHINYYPATASRYNPFSSSGNREIHSYDFFTTEGLNVGTWIPDMRSAVIPQPGFEGRGRQYPAAFFDGMVQGPRADIREFIARAMVRDIDPGDESEQFIAGWERAQLGLHNGASPYEVPEDSSERSSDWHAGYVARMVRERELRFAMPAAGATATLPSLVGEVRFEPDAAPSLMQRPSQRG